MILVGDVGAKTGGARGRRIYEEAVREAMILTCEASDRICGIQAN